MQLAKAFLKHKKDCVKGESGTILVIGGSDLYTGAPLFAGKAALRSGSDLLFILSPSDTCVNALKGFPEAAVYKLVYDEQILKRVTACIIGPGLGTITLVFLKIITDIMDYLSSNQIPVILDADIIHYYKSGYFSVYDKIIITPNTHEGNDLKVSPAHIVVRKGVYDKIVFQDNTHMVCNEGSGKRCGGQGDILAGITATALSLYPHDYIEACVSASQLTRLSSKIAFETYGYSMITTDVIDNISNALKYAKSYNNNTK